MLTAVRDEEKSNGFKKLGPHHQRIILNASTLDVKLPGTAPIPSLAAFLDQKTSDIARSHLKYELHNQFGLHFEPYHQAFAIMLYKGHLLWDRRDCPSNFSIYFCGREAALTATSQESLLLYLSSTEGGGLTEAQILKALKQPRSLPVDFMSKTEKIQNFDGALANMVGADIQLLEMCNHGSYTSLQMQRCTRYGSSQTGMSCQ
jgi:hypothetical protein